MRILLLTQVVPYPPDSGPKVKTYHVLRYLAERGHRVTLVSYTRDGEEKSLASLQPFCAAIHPVPLQRSRMHDLFAYAQSLGTGLPFLVTRDAIPKMKSVVTQLAQSEHFDIVHADQLTMGQYALDVRNWKLEVGGGSLLVTRHLGGERTPRVVFDAHNAVYKIMERLTETAPLPLRPFLAREARLVKQYEGMLVRTFDYTFAVSEQDKQALLEAAAPEGTEGSSKSQPRGPAGSAESADEPTLAPHAHLPWRAVPGSAGVSQVAQRAVAEPFLGQSAIGNLQSKITIVPIAVDTDQLSPVGRLTSPEAAGLAGQSPNILTLGTLYYPPNADGVRWFAQQVYPLVLEQVPAATLTIVGPRPPKDIVALATRHKSLVTVPGYVPDLVPYLERAALMVVPVRAGSGMRVRILEAFARGVPVVTTTTGVEGIEAVDGEHLLVADEPAAFAEAVVRLLRDPELGRRLAANGRRLAEEKYDWRVALPKLEGVYDAVAG